MPEREPPFNPIETTQETEYSPEEIERIKFLTAEFERGIDLENETQNELCIGLHGTSLEVMQELIGSGVITGAAYADGAEGVDPIKQGDLYIFPRLAALPVDTRQSMFPTPELLAHYGERTDEEIKEEAAGYAEDHGQEHALLRLLGFSLQNADPDLLSAANSITVPGGIDNEKLVSFFNQRGITIKKLRAALTAAEKAGGVVFGIHKDALQEHQILRGGDLNERDAKLVLKGGLQYNQILGIEPKGEQEIEFFRKLRAKYG